MPYRNQPPLYSTWLDMKQRCLNPNATAFKDYGGRGITVCERWLKSFKAFEKDMSPKPGGLEIDRINNDGPYSPENCRWVTHKENTRNRRGAIYVEVEGTCYLLAELAEAHGLKPDTIKERVKKGMSFADVTTKQKHHDLSGLALGGAISAARREAKTHCKRGHEFTEENTGRTTKGTRICKVCRNAGQKEYMRRRAAR